MPLTPIDLLLVAGAVLVANVATAVVAWFLVVRPKFEAVGRKAMGVMSGSDAEVGADGGVAGGDTPSQTERAHSGDDPGWAPEDHSGADLDLEDG